MGVGKKNDNSVSAKVEDTLEHGNRKYRDGIFRISSISKREF